MLQAAINAFSSAWYRIVRGQNDKYLCSVVIWIRSPAGEQQSPVLGHVDRASTRLLHEDLHETAADFDVVPAVSSLVLAADQHAQLAADVLVARVDHLLHIQSSAFQLFDDGRDNLARRAVRRHVQYVSLSRIDLTTRVRHIAFNCGHSYSEITDTASLFPVLTTCYESWSPTTRACVRYTGHMAFAHMQCVRFQEST